MTQIIFKSFSLRELTYFWRLLLKLNRDTTSDDILIINFWTLFNMFHIFFPRFLFFFERKRIHILQINHIKVHWSIKNLKFLGRLSIKRKPSQPNKNKIQQNKKYVKSNINFITPNYFRPISYYTKI